MTDVDWKTYYRRELSRPESRGRLVEWLEAEPDGRIGLALDRGGIVSFPHTALAYAGPLQAALVSTLYRRRIERVVALGVLHSGTLPIYRVALDEGRPAEERVRAYGQVHGGFVLPSSGIDTPFGRHPFETLSGSRGAVRVDRSGLLASEFSLDTFVSALRLGADVFGCDPIPADLVFVGMTRHPVTGGYAEARRLARWLRGRVGASTAVVATGDLVHYGTPYGPLDRGAPADPATLEPAFRAELAATLSLAIEGGDLEAAYRCSSRVLRNDQRELLPVIAAYLGAVKEFEIVRFELSDYAEILSVAPPCYVASALVVYG